MTSVCISKDLAVALDNKNTKSSRPQKVAEKMKSMEFRWKNLTRFFIPPELKSHTTAMLAHTWKQRS